LNWRNKRRKGIDSRIHNRANGFGINPEKRNQALYQLVSEVAFRGVDWVRHFSLSISPRCGASIDSGATRNA
jgi:hypothetical protein